MQRSQAAKSIRSSRSLSLLRRLLIALIAVILMPGSLQPVLADAPPSDRLTASMPDIVAPIALVLAETGPTVLFGRGARARVGPASLTKIMTAHVALQRAPLAQRLTVAPSDLVGEASMGLSPGDVLTLETLLHGLLLPSGNDAAMTIARELGAQAGGGSDKAAVARFVGWMNEEAVRLGLTDTRFVNPHGLDNPGHYASAYDLARLTLAAMHNPDFTRIFGTADYAAEGYGMLHGNALVGSHPGVLGGKTGLTDACGFCLVTGAEHDGERIVVVVLQETRAQAVEDTRRLLDWSFAHLDEAQRSGCHTFSATGQTVCGAFLRAWQEGSGLVQFGLPISPEIDERDPATGTPRIVQYFERARLERSSASQQLFPIVHRGLLGRLVTANRLTEPAFAPVVDPGDGAWFHETGHTLRHGFRAHWERTGGLAAYGFPISEEFTENGRTVQYFERARFEHFPEHRGTPHEVQLGHLGRQVYQPAAAARPATDGPPQSTKSRPTNRIMTNPFQGGNLANRPAPGQSTPIPQLALWTLLAGIARRSRSAADPAQL